jgi:hypothetical protein
MVTLVTQPGIHWRLLYRWRGQLDPVDKSEWSSNSSPPQLTREDHEFFRHREDIDPMVRRHCGAQVQ